MTAYNRENYIADAITSVLKSSFQDFELILVDDRSKDRTFEIAKEYAAKDPRIKVYQNEKNLGDYGNRNQAAAYASGKYLKYLDADDMIYKYTLSILVDGMEQFPEAAIGIEQPFFKNINVPLPSVVTPEWVARNQFLAFGVLDAGPSGVIMKRDAFTKIGGFTKVRYTGDTDLWMRLSFAFPSVLFPPGMFFWRQHPEQESHKERAERSVILERYNDSLHYILSPATPLSPNDRDMALKKLNRRFINKLVRKRLPGMSVSDRIWLFRNCRMSAGQFIDALFH